MSLVPNLSSSMAALGLSCSLLRPQVWAAAGCGAGALESEKLAVNLGLVTYILGDPVPVAYVSLHFPVRQMEIVPCL